MLGRADTRPSSLVEATMRGFVTGFGAALVVGVAILLAGGAPTGAQEKKGPGQGGPPRPAGQWEYKVVTGPPTAEEFNRLGADGWELAASTGTTNTGFYHTLKRPK